MGKILSLRTLRPGSRGIQARPLMRKLVGHRQVAGATHPRRIVAPTEEGELLHRLLCFRARQGNGRLTCRRFFVTTILAQIGFFWGMSHDPGRRNIGHLFLLVDALTVSWQEIYHPIILHQNYDYCQYITNVLLCISKIFNLKNKNLLFFHRLK